MNKEICGKIIKLISYNQIVINKGENDGVKVGMIFEVRLTLPDIVDPDDDTNILQGIFYQKGEIRIDSVYDRMSFATLVPRKTYTKPLDFTEIWGTKNEQPQLEYPQLIGEYLLETESWEIKVGDEVCLKIEK